MKRVAAVITGSGEVKAVEQELAPLKDNEVRIKVFASLISPGTEMSGVKAKREKPDKDAEDQVFGYANAGEIIEIKGEAKDLKVGMRVAAMGAGGAHHANYANVPVNMVVPIPDSVKYDQAVYACLGATSLQAVRRTVPQLGEYGMVLGLGIVGNLASQLCQISGGRVIGWEGYESRIMIAKSCGINITVNFRSQNPVDESKDFATPYGNDFAIMAFGGEATEALKSVKSCMKVSADGHFMGRVILVGGCKVVVNGGAAFGNLDIKSAARTGPGYHDPAYEYGKDYPEVFVQFTTQRNLREIIKLIAEKRLIVDPMTTHKMQLEDVGKAADLLVNSPDKAMGIVLEMSH
ncbi:MAG: zinc-binding alcohol dehydrogenase [Lentisphaerae bacterium]|nr:zinc-binding alcohol dehydrogenase [Lentisphaerota bacterium]MCP4101268.1 zinc-binding alcohol dehydrogenase [Lentisphaerota bacterium]